MLAIPSARLPEFERLCQRERCLFAVVGRATKEHQLVVDDPLYKNKPVDMSLDVLLGKPPRMHRKVARVKRKLLPVDLSGWICRRPRIACCACRPWRTRLPGDHR